MQKTWMPTTAGILNIIAGSFAVIAGLAISTILLMGQLFFPLYSSNNATFPVWLGFLGIPLLALGIVAIIGGVYALRRQAWGMALAGAICATFGSSLLGILAIIFTAISKREFDQPQPPPATPTGG